MNVIIVLAAALLPTTPVAKPVPASRAIVLDAAGNSIDGGGLGFLGGDGQLRHSGHERILETDSGLVVSDWVMLTIGYQQFQNPAYNSDRGPAAVFAIGLHAQF